MGRWDTHAVGLGVRRVSRSLIGGFLGAVLLASCGEDAEVVKQPDDTGLDPAIESRVNDWLGQMSLEEKVAQMHGTVLFAADKVYPTADNERLGIPGFRMVDGPRGVAVGQTTTFPVGMARGATWDIELEYRVGEAMGAETAARGANVLLAPTINILRHPAWGRAQETYGEDVHHLGRMGVAFIQGVQQHVLASAKHFAANSIEESRFEVSANMGERTLREIYLPHFEAAVKEANVGSVMSAYNKLNQEYCAENRHLLTEILRDDWGYKYFVESDWVFGTHYTAPSLQAGLDIEMPKDNIYGKQLIDGVNDGSLDAKLVDEAVRRILRTKLTFKLDQPKQVPESVVASPEHRALALQVARQSLVLLENKNAALPLKNPTPGEVAVIGSLSDAINLGDAGSSNNDPLDVVTPLAGISARLEGAPLHIDHDVLTTEDETALGAPKIAIVVVGLTKEDEGESIPGRPGGDRETLGLSAEHQALITRVSELVETTIVVLEGGSAITVAPWVAQVDGLVMAWYGGMNGGTALAEMLWGDFSPSGKLPLSVPLKEQDLVPFDNQALSVDYGYFHGYRQLDHDGLEVQYPFGYGLSYSSFELSDLQVSTNPGAVALTVSLKNTGSVDAAQVIQAYVGYPGSAVERAQRELKAFQRVEVPAGQSVQVELQFPKESLRYWDTASAGWVLEDLDYQVDVGFSSRDLKLNGSFKVK
ncbi:MAG: glycoside hydrolase family 3 C-terminal domain-containing protein [Polyangiaceae bacterium]|nr:glycoside hydrolase family 3 C-terminal domain-containing protein [Myxococcales bacterium]MCB9589892.1 glycoside hydrolase family 3 C-terminal domain-containing protein [Polyangiaceae bacterium]MCB9610403.1 glycoside hydrolase family 3 C-terminal domain-containing protein [Polyangiaceae bacterium]